MRSRAAFAAVVLTLVLMPAAASARQVGHVRVAIDSNASFTDYAKSADRHGYVILQAWQQDRLRALKRANPGVKVLVYKNLAFASSSSSAGLYATGVSKDEADANPDWFLRNTDGERFTSGSYGWQWAMDVGSASYQQRWADNVIAELRAEGWDGVFMDDVNTTFRYHYDPDRVAKYPSDDAYQGAVRSALASIGPRLRGSGKLAIANIGSWSGSYSTGVDWLQFLDGAMDEQFLKWGTDPNVGFDPHNWQTQVNELKAAERMGKDFIGVTHSAPGDERAALYGYATMLLAGDGHHANFALASDYTNETWFPEYDYDLGLPLGPASSDSDGVYRRRFQHGLVVVNPTASAKRVSLAGAYAGSGLARTRTTEMKPSSGLVLKGRSDRGSGGGSPGLLAIVKGRGGVELRWTRGRHRIKHYRVMRNGRVVAVAQGRRFLDRRARGGRPNPTTWPRWTGAATWSAALRPSASGRRAAAGGPAPAAPCARCESRWAARAAGRPLSSSAGCAWAGGSCGSGRPASRDRAPRCVWQSGRRARRCCGSWCARSAARA